MPDPSTQQYLKSLSENYQRNSRWAKSGPYKTPLTPEQTIEFHAWLVKNNIPYHPAYPVHDYDMQGFWLAMKNGDPIAKTAVSKYDGRIHFPDKWKTPYDKTFSNESIYAKPGAPHWKNGYLLVTPGGKVLFNAKKQTGG